MFHRQQYDRSESNERPRTLNARSKPARSRVKPRKVLTAASLRLCELTLLLRGVFGP